MLAQRLASILPPLEPAEMLEVSMIRSLAGDLAGGRIGRIRPFRPNATCPFWRRSPTRKRRASNCCATPLTRCCSARGYHRTLRVARTLADLDGEETVARIHIAEALSYRGETLKRAQAAA